MTQTVLAPTRCVVPLLVRLPVAFARRLLKASNCALGKVTKKKTKKRCKKAGKACKNNKQCCPGKTKRFCDVAQDDSGGNEVCCGREGAKCGGEDEFGNAIAPKCCIGEAGETPQFACSSQTATPGTCQLVPDET